MISIEETNRIIKIVDEFCAGFDDERLIYNLIDKICCKFAEKDDFNIKKVFFNIIKKDKYYIEIIEMVIKSKHKELEHLLEEINKLKVLL